MNWDHRKWGSIDDPIHKSQLSDIAGDFGCLKAFEFKQRRDPMVEPSPYVSGKSVVGNAAHETIARALDNHDVRQRVLSGVPVDSASVAKVFEHQIEVFRDGRELSWGKSDRPDTIKRDAVEMVVQLLGELHKHVAQVVLVEAGFVAPLGKYWTAGHIDLLYRDHSGKLCVADWKTGATKPGAVELEHGFESGLYSNALAEGYFVPRDRLTVERSWHPDGSPAGWVAHCESHDVWLERPTRQAAERAGMEAILVDVAHHDGNGVRYFGEFPDSLSIVHLKDYVPYSRKGSKAVDRPEEMAFYGMALPGRVNYVAGDRRGPAWYPMRRTDSDVPRLQHLLRNVVGVVRMGRFFESISDTKCPRCPFKAQCLTTGYAPQGDEKRELDRSLRVLGDDAFDGFDDEDAA